MVACSAGERKFVTFRGITFDPGMRWLPLVQIRVERGRFVWETVALTG